MMSPNKMVVALLMVSVQLFAVEEASVSYVASFKNFCNGIVNSSKDVASNCAQIVCANKKAVAALIVVSGVSAAAYYNWDRVKQAYASAVESVKNNQEAIVKGLKMGAIATGIAGAIGIIGYKLKDFCFGSEVVEVVKATVAPIVTKSRFDLDEQFITV